MKENDAPFLCTCFPIWGKGIDWGHVILMSPVLSGQDFLPFPGHWPSSPLPVPCRLLGMNFFPFFSCQIAGDQKCRAQNAL